MSTHAQINANRANAQRSTGPRTESGKAAVSQNAVRHGLSSKYVPLSEAERPLFEALEADLRTQVNPSGALQESIFIELTAAAWKRSIVNRLIAEAGESTEALFTGEVSDNVRKLLRHKADQDRAFHRALRELKELQTIDLQRGVALYAHATKYPKADLTGFPGLASYQKFTKQSQSFPPGFEKLTLEELQNEQREAELARRQFRNYAGGFETEAEEDVAA